MNKKDFDKEIAKEIDNLEDKYMEVFLEGNDYLKSLFISPRYSRVILNDLLEILSLAQSRKKEPDELLAGGVSAFVDNSLDSLKANESKDKFFNLFFASLVGIFTALTINIFLSSSLFFEGKKVLVIKPELILLPILIIFLAAFFQNQLTKYQLAKSKKLKKNKVFLIYIFLVVSLSTLVFFALDFFQIIDEFYLVALSSYLIFLASLLALLIFLLFFKTLRK